MFHQQQYLNVPSLRQLQVQQLASPRSRRSSVDDGATVTSSCGGANTPSTISKGGTSATAATTQYSAIPDLPQFEDVAAATTTTVPATDLANRAHPADLSGCEWVLSVREHDGAAAAGGANASFGDAAGMSGYMSDTEAEALDLQRPAAQLNNPLVMASNRFRAFHRPDGVQHARRAAGVSVVAQPSSTVTGTH